MDASIPLSSLTNKTNFLRVILSLFWLYINFNILKRLLTQEESTKNFYALLVSLIAPIFHFLCFQFWKDTFS